MADTSPAATRLVAVLDMGASAIRLVVAERAPGQPIRIVEDASRGVLLGRDTFSSGLIRPQTADAAFATVDGFREVIDGYGVQDVRAVATSAVREARNADLFLDRLRGRTGIAFDVINEAEECRLIYIAARRVLEGHPAFEAPWALLVEVGGGGTSLTLLRRGQPSRSGVFALGSVRLRQRFGPRPGGQDLQVGLFRRIIANVLEQMRIDIPMRRVVQLVALGGDVRLAAAEILDHDDGDGVREIGREQFFAFCDEVEPLDDEALVSRFRLPAVEAETLVPALLVYRALLAETAAASMVVCDASLRNGVLIDVLDPAATRRTGDLEKQVVASAESLGHRFRFDRTHARHVAALAGRLFDELRDEHGLGSRDRLLLTAASLLHDIGAYVSLRAHHKHSQYLIAASQIFGLSDEETAVVSNITRYHRKGTPQRTHLPYLALDTHDQLVVNKLASILRIANALDAEHLQKVRNVRLRRGDKTWTLELEASGDITMELMAAQARSDMFVDVFGRPLVIRTAGVLA